MHLCGTQVRQSVRQINTIIVPGVPVVQSRQAARQEPDQRPIHPSHRERGCNDATMALRVVGQHRGLITLDLNTATVLDLKEAVSRDSGLTIGGLKLLAGGKHLKDDASILAQCGITPGKTIMVLRQDLSRQVQAEAGISRRTEEVAQAASMLSARAARDIGAGGRGNAWGDWGRGGSEGSGGRAGRGHGGARGGGRDDRPEIELTNQDGEAMAIPAEDSAALMEGIILHRKGLACLKRAEREAVLQPSQSSSASPPRDSQVKKRPRQPQTVASTFTAAATGNVGVQHEQQQQKQQQQEGVSGPDQGRGDDMLSGWEERKENMPPSPQDGKEEVGVAGKDASGDGMQVDEPDAGHSSDMALSGSEVEAKGGSAIAARGDGGGLPKNAMAVPGNDDSPTGGRGEGSPGAKSDAKGKGKLKEGLLPPSDVSQERTLSSTDKRLAKREALGLLMRADEAFRRCDPKYLECVDNYAYLCLDIVWLLFLMKDMNNLDLAARMLESVERGFRKAHGPGLQRLTALKGEYCAEKLLYVRLHLLQGVVSFLQGDSGKASGLLIRASEEAKALKPNPVLAGRLARQWRTVKFEALQPKIARLALRAGRNDLDAAWQYLESLRQRQGTVRKERQRRQEQRRMERFGLTANKKAFVDVSLVGQLVDGGFSRSKAISDLRKHNNDVGAALASLTGGGSGISSSNNGNDDEALAVLQSLGVPQEAARDVLDRTGNLRDALDGLGISPPEGLAINESGRMGKRVGQPSSSGGDGDEGEEDGMEHEESSESEGSDGESEGGGGPTEEEMRLYDELAAERSNEDEEGHLDVTLEDEADAAVMYLYLCRGNIPLAFDLDKVRAILAAGASETSR